MEESKLLSLTQKERVKLGFEFERGRVSIKNSEKVFSCSFRLCSLKLEFSSLFSQFCLSVSIAKKFQVLSEHSVPFNSVGTEILIGGLAPGITPPSQIANLSAFNGCIEVVRRWENLYAGRIPRSMTKRINLNNPPVFTSNDGFITVPNMTPTLRTKLQRLKRPIKFFCVDNIEVYKQIFTKRNFFLSDRG